ncbi:MAG: flagellar basal body P-ring protein FlgI [Planctomycetota bacterium]|nr:flagellar basal body P-ring protein FlgI [Planctomycetota bacterium]MDA1214083.1 flagellar basal body P-ring protein FlgI [Planctomycetota bacterium]
MNCLYQLFGPALRPFWVAAIALCTLGMGTPAQARTRLENICTVYGQKEIKLTGTGLVVGLNKTGDGGKSPLTMMALASVMKLNNLPVVSPDQLRDADNVALVMIEATIPRTGIRRGQKIDCYVSSFLGAKSLRGGRLLTAAVETADIGDDSVIGLASGAIYIEGDGPLTTGKIPLGLTIEEDVISPFVDTENGYVITLLLDKDHASFKAAGEVAHVINEEFAEEVTGEIARAVGPGTIDISIPEQYHVAPVDFVAEVLKIAIENPQPEARVIVNAKTGVVNFTGDVEISPIVISHKNLVIEVGGGAEPRGPSFREIPRIDKQNNQTPQQFRDLVEALNQLQVPTADQIEIIRAIHASGRLHAVYVEQ